MLRHTVGAASRPDASNSLRQEVAEGLRYVRDRVWLWATFVCATFTYLLFIGPTQVLLPYVVRNTLHHGAVDVRRSTCCRGIRCGDGGGTDGPKALPQEADAVDLRLVGTGHSGRGGLWVGDELVGPGRRGPRRKRGGSGGRRDMGHAQATTRPQSDAGPGLRYRLVYFHCFAAAQLCLDGTVAGVLGARDTLILAGTLGAVVTIGFLFVPGMREGEQPRAVLAGEGA